MSSSNTISLKAKFEDQVFWVVVDQASTCAELAVQVSKRYQVFCSSSSIPQLSGKSSGGAEEAEEPMYTCVWVKHDGAKLFPGDQISLFLKDKDTIEVHLEKNGNDDELLTFESIELSDGEDISSDGDGGDITDSFFDALVVDLGDTESFRQSLQVVDDPVAVLVPDLQEFEMQMAAFLENPQLVTVADLPEFQRGTEEEYYDDIDDDEEEEEILPDHPIAWAEGTYPFNAEEPDEINFVVGNQIAVYLKRDDGWWKGHVIGETTTMGYFPGNRVKEIPMPEQAAPLDTQSGALRVSSGSDSSLEASSSEDAVLVEVLQECTRCAHMTPAFPCQGCGYQSGQADVLVAAEKVAEKEAADKAAAEKAAADKAAAEKAAADIVAAEKAAADIVAAEKAAAEKAAADKAAEKAAEKAAADKAAADKAAADKAAAEKEATEKLAAKVASDKEAAEKASNEAAEKAASDQEAAAEAAEIETAETVAEISAVSQLSKSGSIQKQRSSESGSAAYPSPSVAKLRQKFNAPVMKSPMIPSRRSRAHSRSRSITRPTMTLTNTTDTPGEQTMALYYGGLELLASSRLNRSLQKLEKCILACPRFAEAYCARGECQMKLGNLQMALKDLNRALQLKPKLVDAALLRAFLALKAGRLDVARAGFEAAKELGAVARAEEGLGWVYLRENNLDAAVTHFSEAIALDPKLSTALGGRGHAYRLQRQVKASIEDLKAAVKQTPRLHEAWLQLGLVLISIFKFDAALVSFSHALEGDPSSLVSLSAKAGCHRKRNEPKLCLETLDTALRHHPGDASLRERRATCRLLLKDYEGAEGDFQACDQLSPVVIEGRATALLALKRPKEALQVLRRGSSPPRLLLAEALLKSGESKLALPILETLVKEENPSHLAYLYLSLAKVAAGDKPGALEAAKMVLHLKPKDKQARHLVKKLSV